MNTIQTKRLLIVPFRRDYLESIVKNRQEFINLFPYQVAKEWPNGDYGEVLPFILETYQADSENEKWSWLVVDKEDNILIGEIGCKGKPDDENEVEIGYGIVPEYRGRGFATEAAQALSQWLISEASINRVKAECLLENIGSVYVLERSGFEKIGQTENMVYWSKTN